LSSCLADNPAKAVDIAANVGLVAGAFAPPMIGLSVAAISQLLKLGVDAATTIPGARAIYKSRKARMPSAMTCGLEALTRDYCKARDAYALVSLSRRDLVGREPSPFFYGIELADRDLPLLYQWLDKVVGGSNSASLDQATKVNEQFSRLNRILQMERNTDGIFGQLEQDLRNPRFTDSDRLSTLKRALRDLMLSALFAEMDMGRPYAYPDGPFTTDNPYYLLAELVGVTNPPEPKDGESINFYIGRLNLRYTDKLPGEIRDRTVALLAARHQRVLAEFIEKVNLNPSVVIREASAQTPGGLSAVYTLERLDRFFDIFALGAGAERAQDEELIRQVRGDLADLKTALTAPEATQPRRAEEIITSVFAKFKLENTNVFLPTHLQSLVRNDLTTRYRRGEGPKDVEDILTTAGRDIDSLLTRTKLGPLEVRGDLELAQSTTLSTLGQFRDFFAPNIAEAMEDLLKQADKNHEPPLAPGSRSPSRHTLARLCLLTLLSGPDWPKDIDKALCRGARMFSPDASLELSFDALDSRFNEAREPIALDDRLCLHQEFLRLDRLASQGLKAPGDAAVHDSGFDPAFWQDALDSRLR
ncbi:MAG: hypothetical protein NDJ90_14440, partial [Oligoflexia bacterium]|nr:hypothetical protein [Oligoflexia bacterium]